MNRFTFFYINLHKYQIFSSLPIKYENLESCQLVEKATNCKLLSLSHHLHFRLISVMTDPSKRKRNIIPQKYLTRFLNTYMHSSKLFYNHHICIQHIFLYVHILHSVPSNYSTWCKFYTTCIKFSYHLLHQLSVIWTIQTKFS